MILKTRKALPKFRLFRKFKVDFFDVFSKGARVSRKYLYFYVRRYKRYAFWHARNLRTSFFNKYSIGGLIYPFYSKRLLIVKKFSLLPIVLKRSYQRLVNRLVQSVVMSNSARVSITANVSNIVAITTPVNYRLSVLYNFKKA